MYIYLAYGSNLHFEQMHLRCPDSIYLGSGYLKQAELQFKGHPGNCHCTVDMTKKNKKVPIGIFSVSERDIQNLDRYEGVSGGYYRKEKVSANRVTIKQWLYPDIKFKDSFIYIMNGGLFGPPSRSYYFTVKYGYSCCNLDERFLQEALTKAIKEYNKLC